MTASNSAITLLNRQLITPPVLIGTGTAASGSGSITVTTTAAVPPGSLVFMAIMYLKNSSITITQVTEGIQFYSLAKSATWSVNTFAAMDLWYKENVTAIPSSTVCTASFSATSSNGDCVAAMFYCPGQQLQTSSLDKSASNSEILGSTSCDSGATAALAQSSELLIGLVGGYGGAATNPTFTDGSGYTQIQNTISGGRYVLHSAYNFQNNATTAAQYTATASTSLTGGILVATFKA
jgi:hypothetical protein